MRLPRAVPAALLLAALAVAPALAACSDDDGAPVDTTPTESSAPPSTPATPSSTPPTSGPTTSTPPAPTDPASSSPAPSAPAEPPSVPVEVPDVCAVVTAQQVSDVLFVPVSQDVTEGGCRYAVPDDATAPAVDYVQTTDVPAGTVARARRAAAQQTGARVQPVDDVGEEAFVAVGPGPDGQVRAVGGVRVGRTFVQVTITQSQDLVEPEVGQYGIDAIGLAGDALEG